MLTLLETAQHSRRTANNSVNERSSRSHAVLQFVLRDRAAAMVASAPGAVVGKFTLVDLAGSERAADTQEAGAESRAEGADINKSLLTLKVRDYFIMTSS